MMTTLAEEITPSNVVLAMMLVRLLSSLKVLIILVVEMDQEGSESYYPYRDNKMWLLL
jgi:hypothetical protein